MERRRVGGSLAQHGRRGEKRVVKRARLCYVLSLVYEVVIVVVYDMCRCFVLYYLVEIGNEMLDGLGLQKLRILGRMMQV